SQGTVLRIDGVSLGVEEACSGLRMLTVLLALGGTISAVSSRPMLDRTMILISMAPLAVAVNVARIVGTAIVFRATNDPGVLVWAHDLAGWVMPLVAVGLLHL